MQRQSCISFCYSRIAVRRERRYECATATLFFTCVLTGLGIAIRPAAAEPPLTPSFLLLAADTEMGSHDAAAHRPRSLHGEHYKGNPKEDPKQPFGYNTDFLYWSPQLFVWTLALFLLLWFILGRWVWKPMLESFEDRDRRIQESLALAEKLRDEAKSIADTMDIEVVRAQQAVRTTLDQARAEANQEVVELMAKARQEQTDDLSKARADIDSAVALGKADIEGSSRRLGVNIAQTLMESANGGRP